MVEILDGRHGKRSVERVRYVINNLLHLVIVKNGDISLVLCITSQLVKYLVIFHADPCNKYYIIISIGNHMGLSAIWRKKLHGNRQVIAFFFKLHSKTCGYLLIILHLANKN